MKVYVYGTYTSGFNNRRVMEYESITHNMLDAFIKCYEIGLDGNDYFLIEYDTDEHTKKSIFINDAQYYTIWKSAKNVVANTDYTAKIKPLRADDV